LFPADIHVNDLNNTGNNTFAAWEEVGANNDQNNNYFDLVKHAHRCDVTWACNPALCSNEEYRGTDIQVRRDASFEVYDGVLPRYGDFDWLDGCEVAHNYSYPFVTVQTKYPYDGQVGNPIYLFYDYVVDLVDNTSFSNYSNVNNAPYNPDFDANVWFEPHINFVTFYDPAGLYNYSSTFGFDCQYFLADQQPNHQETVNDTVWSLEFCADDGVEEPYYWEAPVYDENWDYIDFYPYNYGCHLGGSYAGNEYHELGFGCNGVWNTPNPGMCVLNCAEGYFDADLDPRNGCETDTIVNATPEDRFVWVGNCVETAGSVNVKSSTSCGADLCVDCTALPGVVPVGPGVTVGKDIPDCALVEEITGKIPVLAGPEDYYSIQYACGVYNGKSSPRYTGRVDFNDNWCDASKCADGDDDWTNGCEQARGYTGGLITDFLGTTYDGLFDFKVYLPNGSYVPCDPEFTDQKHNLTLTRPVTLPSDIDTPLCDRRSSGFENPIPGVWFYMQYASLTGDWPNDYLGKLTLPASRTWEFLWLVGPANVTYAADGATTGLQWGYGGPVSSGGDGLPWDLNVTLNYLLDTQQPNRSLFSAQQALNNKAYDCSHIYSTEYSYDKWGIYQGPGNSGYYTFGQAFHVDTTQYYLGKENNVCDRTTGQCRYVCAAGWADYDLDPSNGCETDLSGPCGVTRARNAHVYSARQSCGEFCLDCNNLPGAYNVPQPTSECLPVDPVKYIDNNPAKAAFLSANTRFGYTCVTETIRPLQSLSASQIDWYGKDAWTHIVCDPRKCFDRNWYYEDGCEEAHNYSLWWTDYDLTGAELPKASFNHWFSPIYDPESGSHLPERTYFLRLDGKITIGRQGFPPTPPPDVWVELFSFDQAEDPDLLYGTDSLIQFDTNERNGWYDFYFHQWDITDAPGYFPNKWYNNVTGEGSDDLGAPKGYNIFPYQANDDIGLTGAYDCNNAELPWGFVTFNVTFCDDDWDLLDVNYTFNTAHEGPWFHVNQSAVTQCDPGANPGATINTYTGLGFSLSSVCTQTANQQASLPDKGCYSTWHWKGAGLCKLGCENNWANRDNDPTNGCESYLLNGFPYPNSRCGGAAGKTFNNPATDPTLFGTFNFDQTNYCGAGVCLQCGFLSGVNTAASNINAGLASTCIDGGDYWIDSDNGTVINDIAYPGDYYCYGILNEQACLRSQLKYGNCGKLCPNSFLWANATTCNGGTCTTQTVQANSDGTGQAAWIQVCTDVDELWETGCEVALGYNLGLLSSNLDVPNQPRDIGGNITLNGVYNRAIGVKPAFDGNFNEIGWGPVGAGFDCEILRLLPRAHTHVKQQTLLSNVIGCTDRNVAYQGTCSFTCDTDWRDCDGNPWNGCEQSELLCGGASYDCNTPEINPVGYQPPNGQTVNIAICTSFNLLNQLNRPSFCDGNQIPWDQWRLYYDSLNGFPNTLYGFNDATDNYDDAGQYDDYFEITDWGMLAVDVTSNYVDPWVSRYTIKGYWDDVDVDYSCRVWLNIDDLAKQVPVNNLRSFEMTPDKNFADGKCVLDCGGVYSDCDGIDWNGCETHNIVTRCLGTDGLCVSCVNLPGVISGISSKCLYKNGVVDIVSFSTTWPEGSPGILDDHLTVSYGTAGAFDPINNQHPQCDTRGKQSGSDGVGGNPLPACDDNLCRDYDNDWENGCEYPVNYDVEERKLWENPSVQYLGNEVFIDGFDCSWINDPQPNAGGRNYGGLTWAQKYHVKTSGTGGSPGYCVGQASAANAGQCNIKCEAGWTDCDLDPSNGCENDESLCQNCVFATGYPDYATYGAINCSTLVNVSKGFVTIPGVTPKCNGRENEDGQCSWYFCNIFNRSCDSGLGGVLDTQGCVAMTDSDPDYCGADWNWRDIRANESTVSYELDPIDDPEYLGGRMLDYSVFDGTGRCASCSDLDGYISPRAYCQYDPVVAGLTYDQLVYYKPGASGEITNGLGNIVFDVAGNTVGEYLCQLHGEIGEDDDGACDRDLCVDEDYFWANGCETAVNYDDDLLRRGVAGDLRHEGQSGDFSFDYHFAYNNPVFGKNWTGSSMLRSEIRGIWCPFLQFWSLATDDYDTGDCDVFPCPHLAPSTVDNWITCVNNATDDNAGTCNFVCNEDEGWMDCDANPMTGCETDYLNDGTCGSECQRVECNELDGLNPWYWSECLWNNASETASCDLSICEDNLCIDEDGNWTNGCEYAVNYPAGPDAAGYDCRTLNWTALHLAWVEPCNGEPGHQWEGKCEFECEPGWVDCNGLFVDGCEHDGSLCQNCTKALGYVTYFDGADTWEYQGAAVGNEYFYSVVYGSRLQYNFLTETYSFWNETVHANGRKRVQDQFAGPEVAFAHFHRAYVAAFDCDTLATTYPGHFTAAPECDADITSPSAGLCTYTCNNANGYFDCDGDPRNGCEHESLHESCGAGGACRNCYYISGVDYPHYDYV